LFFLRRVFYKRSLLPANQLLSTLIFDLLAAAMPLCVPSACINSDMLRKQRIKYLEIDHHVLEKTGYYSKLQDQCEITIEKMKVVTGLFRLILQQRADVSVRPLSDTLITLA